MLSKICPNCIPEYDNDRGFGESIHSPDCLNNRSKDARILILTINPKTIKSAVLSCYNRFHNRHFKSKAPLTKFQEEWGKKGKK